MKILGPTVAAGEAVICGWICKQYIWMNGEVESFLSEKVSDLFLTWRITSITVHNEMLGSFTHQLFSLKGKLPQQLQNGIFICNGHAYQFSEGDVAEQRNYYDHVCPLQVPFSLFLRVRCSQFCVIYLPDSPGFSWLKSGKDNCTKECPKVLELNHMHPLDILSDLDLILSVWHHARFKVKSCVIWSNQNLYKQ